MATVKKVLTPAQQAALSAELTAKEAVLQGKIDRSGDFFSAGTPTTQELMTDVQMRDVQARQKKLESQILAREVYGLGSDQDKAAINEPKEGLIQKGVGILSRPLYGLVGAVKYAVGKGESTLGESVMQNVAKNKDTFGSLLRSVGAPASVAMPIGFGLDVLADPFNLMTGGIAGLSRTGLGKVVKGAVTSPEALGTAVKLTGAKNLNLLTKLVPGLSVDKVWAKKMAEMAANGVSKDSPEFADAVKRAYKPSEGKLGTLIGKARVGKANLLKTIEETSNKYDALTNWNLDDILESRANRQSALDLAVEFGRSSSPRAKAFVDAVVYDPYRWSQSRKALAEAKYELETQGLRLKQVMNPETGMLESPKLEDISRALGEDVTDTLRVDVENLSKPELLQNYQKMFDESLEMINRGENFTVPNTIFASDAANQEARMMAIFNRYNKALADSISDQNLKFVEDINKKIVSGLNTVIRDPKKVQSMIDAYDIYRGYFIKSKISSMSPSSIIYASIGNPTMKLMYGFNILHRDNFTRLRDAIAVIGGVDKKRGKEVLNWLVTDEAIKDLWMKRSDDWIDSFGIDLAGVSKQFAAEKKLKAAMTVPEIKEGGLLEVDKAALKNMIKLTKPTRESATGVIAYTEENLSGFTRHLERMRELAKSTDKTIKTKMAKLAVAYTNRAKDFQKVDQINKFSDFSRLVRDGVPEKELLKVTNNSLATNARIFPDDINLAYWKNGEKYFTIKPEKAMEIVNDIYMNYAAMPAFIRTLRSMPVVGSPFFAFTYAMMTKTGKTLLNNPAAFNKINFLLQELESDKSPLEREALRSKYYSYLDKPGMINIGENLPFYKGHPIYINLAQMVPYYTLQIFNQSQRGFNDDIRGKFASAIDKSPLFKDPVGQMLMDYVILPAIIRDQMPVNMFGTPLYEKDASLPLKMAYAGRTLTEALTPSLPSAAVTTAFNPFISDEMMKWFPSYPGRKTGFAVRGQTAVGVIGNEDAASRGMRAWLSNFGINLYPIDLVNISNEIKKRKK